MNLADSEEGRFLRLTMTSGVDGKLSPTAKNESKEPEAGAVSTAAIRDSILTVLAQCNSDVRQAVGGTFVARLLGTDRRLRAASLDPTISKRS